ncbi:MAG: restriction endonuclease subunit S [Actinobacteria bacterium]|nr:restriction endonuclease subunit S [Actinomycetota bacterium]MCL5072927.1 restriction endonuclease subunit S [Actinomycetota bacterium]
MRKPYPSYKDSGVEWIGNIPKHWATSKLKYLSEVYSSTVDRYIYDDEIQVSICHYPDVYKNEFVDEDTLLNKGSCNQVEFKRFQLEKGLVILTKDSETPDDIGIPCYIEKNLSNVVCGYHLSIIKTNNNHINSKFLFRFIQSDKVRCHFEVQSKGIIRFSLGKSIIENLFVNLPPLPEQQQIVEYLDNRTKPIDELIEKTKQKIELLKEKRTSLINHSVTKGLNPDVEMKDSGIEWIGEIPKHWIISKFKYDTITPVRYGLNIENNKYANEGIRFIRITDLDDWGGLNPENGKYLTDSDVDNEFLLNKYDLLLCRSGHTVGKSYLHLLDGKYTSGGYLVRFNFGNYFSSKFIFYVTKTHFYWNWLYMNTIISTIENVNGEKYSNFNYPKPPITEQQQIVEYLDFQMQKIDDLIEKENKRIELLKEYRQSLISEAVTGKIDIRDKVAV